ncbi:MAG TPA: DinB family protein [Candidatus Limnocylindria bacterium]|nr:DinB family protein [Candidatus Limnocylindria bacterium]
MTTELTPEQVVLYLESTCALIESELKALGDDASWHQAPGEWCAREVVGHIIEAEKRGFAGRIRIILANERPNLQAWDQVEVEKERNDCARVTDSLWMEFMGLRHASVDLVKGLTATDLDRSGMHPKVGELKVRGLLQEWVHHDRNHTKQLLSIAMERVWPHMRNSQKFKGE